jgi:hypothetical protein
MKRLLIALAFLCTPALAAPPTIIINDFDPGGPVSTYVAWWKRVNDSGAKLVIDAPCVSACTIFLGFPDLLARTCITSRGALGFHEASTGGASDGEFTKAAVRWLYPKFIQEWIISKGGLQEDVRYMWPEDLKGHIPLCSGSEYNDIHPDTIIKQEPVVAAPPHPVRETVKPKEE